MQALRKGINIVSRVRQRLAAVRRRAKRLITSERGRRRQIFRDIYKNNLWGNDGISKYFSGVGSRGEAADIYVERMAKLLEGHAVELGRPITIVDLGCGDFQVGRALMAKLPDHIYLGCDIVPELIVHNTSLYGSAQIRFRQLDIVADPLPEGDIYLVRQVLQHLSNADIRNFLRRVSCKYLYVTEGHPLERIGPVNPDKVTDAGVRFDWQKGRGRGVELDLPPYGARTQEVFRAYALRQAIITERVFLECRTNVEASPVGNLKLPKHGYSFWPRGNQMSLSVCVAVSMHYPETLPARTLDAFGYADTKSKSLEYKTRIPRLSALCPDHRRHDCASRNRDRLDRSA
jgi:O-methyltransferase domain